MNVETATQEVPMTTLSQADRDALRRAVELQSTRAGSR